MAQHHPFASAEELVAHMQGAVQLDDPRLPQVLAAASRAVRAYCRWHVAPVVTETVTLDGDGSGRLLLPSLRVRAVTAVRSGGLAQNLAHITWSRSGLLLSGYLLSGAYRGIEVDLTHGHDLEDVPEVVSIVLQAAARALASPVGYTREQSGSIGVAPTLTGPSAAGGVHLLEHERADLAEYRLVLP